LPVSPPTHIANMPHAWSAATLLEHMRSDKKATAGALTFVLARGVGRAFVQHGVDPAPVERTLARALAA
jgi:3-dehydroquinate synthetase